MTGPASYLLFYPPAVLAILVVLELVKHDEPRKVLQRALLNFLVLTGVLLGGSLAVFFVNKYF